VGATARDVVSMTAIRETGSIIPVRKSELVITVRETDAGAEEVGGIEADSIVSSGLDSICSGTSIVKGADSVPTVTAIQQPMRSGAELYCDINNPTP